VDYKATPKLINKLTYLKDPPHLLSHSTYLFNHAEASKAKLAP